MKALGGPYIYVHFTRLPDGFDRYWGYIERASRSIVQDRFHMSEIVYAAARGDPTLLTPEVYRLVDARLRQLGAFTVLVTASSELIAARWERTQRDQMYGLEKTLAAGRLFGEINITHCELGTYQCDVDQAIHLTESKEYPDESDVTRILEQYRARQQLIDQLVSQRPAAL